MKNDFLEFMHSPDSATAKERLALWLFHAENSHIPEFEACITAVRNWSEHILNSFDVPYSNGFTEGCNNKTKYSEGMGGTPPTPSLLFLLSSTPNY